MHQFTVWQEESRETSNHCQTIVKQHTRHPIEGAYSVCTRKTLLAVCCSLSYVIVLFYQNEDTQFLMFPMHVRHCVQCFLPRGMQSCDQVYIVINIHVYFKMKTYELIRSECVSSQCNRREEIEKQVITTHTNTTEGTYSDTCMFLLHVTHCVQ